MTLIRGLTVLVLATVLGATAAGCERQSGNNNSVVTTTTSTSSVGTSGANTITMVVNGREFRAVTDGPVGFTVQNGGVLVSTGSHKIAIEGELVMLDGVEIATCPATATKVEVQLEGGRLTVLADGVAAVEKQLGN